MRVQHQAGDLRVFARPIHDLLETELPTQMVRAPFRDVIALLMRACLQETGVPVAHGRPVHRADNFLCAARAQVCHAVTCDNI